MTEIELARDSLPEVPSRALFTRKRRAAIIAALQPKEKEDGRKTPGSFVADAARYAGLSPKLLEAWLAHGEQYPNGPMGRLTKDVYRLIAERNDLLQEAIWNASDKKNAWEGFARLGEQGDPQSWTRPTEGGTTINVNIVDKLALVRNERPNQVTTGD